MKIASYAMIPIGIAGVGVGVYEALTGYALLGAVVALLGAVATPLAVGKLHRRRTNEA